MQKGGHLSTYAITYYDYLINKKNFNMKKIIMLMLLLVTLVACNQPSEREKANAREFLRNEISFANDQLTGMQMDYATISDGCNFMNDNVYYYYTIDEDYINISDMIANEREIKRNLRSTLESMPETEALIQNLKKINGKIIYQYTGDITGKTAQFVLDF